MTDRSEISTHFAGGQDVISVRGLVDSGRFPEAIERLRVAPALDAEGHYLLAFCLISTGGDPALARVHLDDALDAGFDPFWAHYYRALANRSLGDQDGAVHDMAKALAINASHTGLRDLLAAWTVETLSQHLPPGGQAVLIAVNESIRKSQQSGPSAPPPRSVLEPESSTAADGSRDLLLAQNLAVGGSLFAPPFALRTEWPLASDSNDHLWPWGTRRDNTRHPAFVAACERLYGRKLAILDLGCAGGGLVLDFLLGGHRAIGLEGSDYSLRRQRAEWRVIPNHLATCDVAKHFTVLDGELPARFDVITAWEVLEHLREEQVPAFLENVRRHLAPDGLFAASIAQTQDEDEATGAVYHQTIRPQAWWNIQVARAGLVTRAGLFALHEFPRGSGNGRDDWDVARNPEIGFHLLASLPTAPPMAQKAKDRFVWHGLPDGRPAFSGEVGTGSPDPIAVISIPKAGTYLVGRLLSALGCVDTRIHAGPEGFDDYRGHSLEESRRDYLTFSIQSDIRETLRLVGPGQFIVGHLPGDAHVRAALCGFKRLLLVRDLRDGLVSHMRFIGSTGRGGAAADRWRALPDTPDKMLVYLDQYGESYLRMCEGVASWRDDPDALVVRFETLMGDDGDAAVDALISGICKFTGICVRPWADLKAEVLGVETLTWSGRRTRRSNYWNMDVDAWFRASAGPALNKSLGY